ncbi:MAG: glycosyltransferase 87 family protein [Actinomycetota bacterium]
MERAVRPVSLLLVLGCTCFTLILGSALKGPCVSGSWSDGRQYRLLCYSDIVPLLNTEQLAGNRLPFLQPCLETGGQCDEYPVLTMYFMRVAAWVGGSTTAGFFTANAILLWVCAAAIATFLYMLGGRALWFALAPTLLIYGFMNWDLFAVALATGALVAFARRRDGLAGVLLGLGAAAKLYPAMLALPLIAHRLRNRQPDSAIRIGWATAGIWLLVNAPFAIASPSSWWTFFRFNSARAADWDSIWFIGCKHVDFSATCGHTSRINVASLMLFVSTFLLVWIWKRRREPGFARWSLAFPMLVLFLLSNKVYSPQYGLWLLPFFALGAVDLRTFVAFEAADVAVFVTRFSFFGDLTGVGGLPFGAFEIAIAVRTLVLVWSVVTWVRRPTTELPDLEAFVPGAKVATTEAPT